MLFSDGNWTLSSEKSFAGKFDAWDENGDGFVDVQEVFNFFFNDTSRR